MFGAVMELFGCERESVVSRGGLKLEVHLLGLPCVYIFSAKDSLEN